MKSTLAGSVAFVPTASSTLFEASAKNSPDTRHHLGFERRANQFAEQPLLGRAVLKNGGIAQMRTKQIPHQIVVALPVHPRFDVAWIHSVCLQVTLPSQRMCRHGVDHHPVKIEDESQFRIQSKHVLI